jgi:hypothetical protein
MGEDLLDYWVRLLRTIFPANARINSRFSNNDHLIQIEWKLQNYSGNPLKSSNKIEIMIKEHTIEDYLDKNTKDRRLSETMLKEFVVEQYNHFIFENDIHPSQSVSPKRWLISADIMNCKPPFDIPLRDQVESV